MQNIIAKAMKFAFDKHECQVRKNSNIPYISHPLKVGELVKLVTTDEQIIAAAILHDVMEDCGVTYKEIEKEFGERVASIVLQLTKPGNKPMKKSREALMIKCADVLHNISDGEDWYIQKKLKDIWS